jgi:hypothetical protein
MSQGQVMTGASPDTAARFWQRLARRLAWRVNAAAWWDGWITPAVVVSALSAGAVLAARRQGFDSRQLWMGLAVALLLCALWAAWRARRRFFSESAALVELDVALGLKTRLTAASAGVGHWPEIPSRRVSVLRWKLSRVLVPPGFALAMLAVAGFIPVSKAREVPRPPAEPPAAWQEMDQWLKGLEQQELAKPEAIESWEERVNRLRKQPESAWYGHGSLEAGDTLHQQLEVGLRSMGSDLDEAAEAVEMMESVGGKSHDAQSEGSDAQLDRAMQRLEAGTVPLHPKLLSQLKAAAGKNSKPLSMAELQKLQRRLRESAGFCRLQIRECKAGHKDCTSGRCIGKGNRHGHGGISRGRGDAPMSLAEQASRTDSTLLEGVANEDLQHSALGDTIGMSRTGHQVERGQVRSMSGGHVTASPAGGETVWRDALTPEEQQVLQRYFK